MFLLIITMTFFLEASSHVFSTNFLWPMLSQKKCSFRSSLCLPNDFCLFLLNFMPQKHKTRSIFHFPSTSNLNMCILHSKGREGLSCRTRCWQHLVEIVVTPFPWLLPKAILSPMTPSWLRCLYGFCSRVSIDKTTLLATLRKTSKRRSPEESMYIEFML